MNEAFRLLFDEVRSGIVWVERTGAVRYANKAAVQLTPCLLGQPLMDPVADRAIRDAARNLIALPHRFEMRTQEAHADLVRAVVLPAPVGKDLMLVLNNISEERWYGQALTNLVRYVEAEMGEPLAELGRDLQALPLLGPDASARPPAQQALATKVASSARAVAGKLSGLHELIQVFGASALRTDERVMLTQLVRDAVAGVAADLDARNVKLELRGLDQDLTIYGSAHWLARALSEYLKHCIRSATPGSRIDLSLQATGTRVLLRTHNQGLFLSNHARRAAQVPFGVGDQAQAATPHIGLALATSVVEQHGGLVRIEDNEGSVDFVMELPSGAPAAQNGAASGADIAVEQAQRYAHDMARLMDRQLKRQAALKSPPTPPI